MPENSQDKSWIATRTVYSMLQGNTIMHTILVKFTKMPFGKSAAGKNICCIVNFSQRRLGLSPRTGSPVPHSTWQICTTCTSCEAHACASCAMTPMRSIACRCAWHDASQGERIQHEWQQDRRTGNTEFKLYTKSCCHGLHCYLSQLYTSFVK